MEWIHVSYVKFMKQTSLMLHNKTQAGELDPGGTVPCLHNYLESFGVDFLGWFDCEIHELNIYLYK